MADTGAIRAGKASVEISADDKGLSAGMARAQKRLAEFGSAMKAVGVRAFALGAGAAAALLVAGRALAGNGEALAQRAGLLGQDGTEIFETSNILGRAFDRLSIAGARLAAAFAPLLLPFLEYMTDAISLVAKWTSEWMKQKGLLGGLGDAIIGGDFVLAFQVGLGLLKVAWLEFRNWLMQSFPAIGTAFNYIWEAGAFVLRRMQQSFEAILLIVRKFGEGASFEEIGRGLQQINTRYVTYDLQAANRLRNPGDFGLADARGELADLQAQAAAARGRAEARRQQDAGGLNFGARGTFNSAIGFGLAAPGNNNREQVLQRINSDTIRAAIAAEQSRELLRQIAQAVTGAPILAFQ